MKILLDECIDWRLSREFSGHKVKTARQMGCAAIDDPVKPPPAGWQLSSARRKWTQLQAKFPPSEARTQKREWSKLAAAHKGAAEGELNASLYARGPRFRAAHEWIPFLVWPVLVVASATCQPPA